MADALGVHLEPPQRLWHISRLAWRTIPYAFSRAGAELTGSVVIVLNAPNGELWQFGDCPAMTTVRGDAVEFCLVAGRRIDPAQTNLTAEGPDASAVLRFVRTYA